MDKKELEQLQEKEQYDVKYMSELRLYWNAYSYAMINEIYAGVAINLGMPESEAYKLAKNRPGDLQKSKFFKGVFERFKKIFNYKIPKFRYKKKLYDQEKPMTEKQWAKFNKHLDSYFSRYMNKVAENMTVKSNMLGQETTDFRRKKKPYKNKSLYQVEYDQYDGDMPDTLVEAYRNYDFKNSEKNALNKQFSSISMYVKQSGNDMQEAIRQQIQSGLDNNKSSIEVASDLYWNVEKNKDLVNEYTAETRRKDWNRIASTEMATVYEAGILAPYEAEAMQSLKYPARAQYFVFTGGTCPWCRAHQGVLARLVPTSVVADTTNDSLKSMGIKDPNTDIAVWVGKNNVGFKETKAVQEWRICAPAHPYNVATLQPIDIDSEWYNPKTGNVEQRLKKQKFVPKQVDYSQKSKEETEWRKPTFVGSNLVRFNNNLYEAVAPGEYNNKLEEWRKDPQLPIPVNKNNKNDMKIFDEAEKNR
ncbi:hypothetical protein KAR91_29825 [Candidatus Pacearchaeota archaeon]|nr:hypothetical protein [Candidatus Pacearchaeota archaeon]